MNRQRVRAFLLTGVPIEWPLFAVGSTLVGMMARMLFPDLQDAELATPTMIVELLPAGVAGIVIAAYIAAVMSSADSCLIGPVAIFTNDIYRKCLNQQASDRTLVRVARISTLVMGILAIATAWLIPNVLELILYAYTFGAAGIYFFSDAWTLVFGPERQRSALSGVCSLAVVRLSCGWRWASPWDSRLLMQVG